MVSSRHTPLYAEAIVINNAFELVKIIYNFFNSSVITANSLG